VYRLGLSLACHAFTLCSMCRYCNPLARVRCPTEFIDPTTTIELDDSMSGKFIGSWTAIDRRRKGSGLLYLVEWKGFDNTPTHQLGTAGHLKNARD